MGGPGVSYAGDEDETRAVRESMMTLAREREGEVISAALRSA